MTHVTNFKQPRSRKVDRFYKRLDLKRAEDRNKAEVRRRDKRCRMPLCGCKKMAIRAEVSHAIHKGMGGNPAGDRSAPELMMLLCACRHKENAVSIDRGTLKWVPLTADGANGPVAWYISASVIPEARSLGPDARLRLDWDFYNVARERSVGVLEPLDAVQRVLLGLLAEMRL